MKVTAAPSFFKSLREIGTLRSKFKEVVYWIKMHTKKRFLRVLKTALSGYPFDSGYLLELEQAKLNEIAKAVGPRLPKVYPKIAPIIVGAPVRAVTTTAFVLFIPPAISGTDTDIPSGILCRPITMASTSPPVIVNPTAPSFA